MRAQSLFWTPPALTRLQGSDKRPGGARPVSLLDAIGRKMTALERRHQKGGGSAPEGSKEPTQVDIPEPRWTGRQKESLQARRSKMQSKVPTLGNRRTETDL